MTDRMKLISECSMKITPNVINMITGLEQNDIKIGEMVLDSTSTFNSPNCTIVRITYTKGLSGECYLIIDNATRDKLVAAMMGMPSLEGMDVGGELLDSAICELMNQLSGSIISSAAELANTAYDISCPELVGASILLDKKNKVLLNVFHNPTDNITIKLINNLM